MRCRLHSAARRTRRVPWLCDPVSRRVCYFVDRDVAGRTRDEDGCMVGPATAPWLWRVRATRSWYPCGVGPRGRMLPAGSVTGDGSRLQVDRGAGRPSGSARPVYLVLPDAARAIRREAAGGGPGGRASRPTPRSTAAPSAIGQIAGQARSGRLLPGAGWSLPPGERGTPAAVSELVLAGVVEVAAPASPGVAAKSASVARSPSQAKRMPLGPGLPPTQNRSRPARLPLPAGTARRPVLDPGQQVAAGRRGDEVVVDCTVVGRVVRRSPGGPG